MNHNVISSPFFSLKTGHYLSWGKTAVKLEGKGWCDSQKLFRDEGSQHTEMVTTQMQLVKKKHVYVRTVHMWLILTGA